jgi:hypothetical protein
MGGGKAPTTDGFCAAIRASHDDNRKLFLLSQVFLFKRVLGR